MKRLVSIPLVSMILALAACSDAPDGDDTRDTQDGDDASDTTRDVDTSDVPVTAWPWPAETIDVPSSAHWRGDITFPADAFANQSQGSEQPTSRWVKFAVLVGDPTRVYFQDSIAYPFHYDFARVELPPFAGLDAAEFDRLTLDDFEQRRAILGAVMFAPDSSWGGPPVAREIGITLVGRDGYPAIVSETVLSLVRDHIAVSDGGAAPTTFYFPAFEQQAQAALDAERLLAAGFPLSGPERWTRGNVCYASGWALGRIVAVPSDEIDLAYGDGRLGPDDILLTDGVPAEVPFVAAILSTAASTPSSHVAILASTFHVPFVYLADDDDRYAAQVLVGALVALRASDGYAQFGFAACDVSFVPIGDGMSPQQIDAVRALKAPAALDFPPRQTLGHIAVATDALTPSDIRYVGGKAAHFGLLRRTIPEASPSPAWAFSFDLWERVIGPLRASIDARLAAYGWPADITTLRADLADVRAMVKGLSLPADVMADIRTSLEAAGFSATDNIRFRSSTNVEDQATFTGAGLYDSYSGCLADDTDEDTAGPSRCDASESDERGVFRAIKKVYASFWNDNAFLERRRHAVDESEVGMGLLVHASYPDPVERANGVATLSAGNDGGTFITLSSQLGAVSITNPDASAQPEVVRVSVYNFGTYFDTLQQSSLVPLGGHVMAWEDDYAALVALLLRVSAGWAKDIAPAGTAYTLDLEWKRIERPGEAARLEMKQVRPLPRPDRERTLDAFLLPGELPELCTFQGEHGGAFGNWRLKARVTLAHDATWLDAARRQTTFYNDLTVQRADGVQSGAPGTFPGAFHEAGGLDTYGNPTPAIDGWVIGSGETRASWSLSTTLPWRVSPAEVPLVTLDDAWLTLDAAYDTPRVEPGQWPDDTTLLDTTRLGPCPEDVVVTPLHIPVHRTATSGVGGVSVDIRFWWPPAPTGITAGYTAPLAKWDVTTITGLVAEPITLTGYWSQTYRPGHHNFSETFIFEPALEEGIDAAIVAELDARDIQALIVEVGLGAMSVVGADGAIRPLPLR